MQDNVDYHKLVGEKIPLALRDIDAPPKQLYLRGSDPNKLLSNKVVSIVGTRKPTPYGREVTSLLTSELAKHGVVIVSGLALGVDTIAHNACLKANGNTIAVLPCGPEQIYPSTHRHVASQILRAGGSIVTEYSPGTPPLKQHFIARNRLVSGMSDILVVTEAAEKSGTLHTANFALNQSKTVMAVPGPINSSLSKGTNNLIKAGAVPITSAQDILFQLGIDSTSAESITAANKEEHSILELLKSGVTNGEELLEQSKLPVQRFNQTITILEINGQVRALGNNHWQLN